MTYLAPRQGLFAIIILISFFIQTTLLLISTDQQLDALKMQTGERMLVQMIDEVKLPLLSKDKVSLSVLTQRYTSESNVASITIEDIDGEPLLQTGQSQLLGGDVISRQVILSDSVIGEVKMTLKDTSNGEIIASQWIFILGSFITHLLIWLIYGYIARPTRAQLAALSRDVQDHLLRQQRSRFNPNSQRGLDMTETDNALSQNAQSQNTPPYSREDINVHQALNQYIQSHKDDADTQSSDDMSIEGRTQGASLKYTGHTQTSVDAERSEVSQTGSSKSDAGEVALNKETRKSTGLVATRALNTVTVQVHFYDPNRLMNTLADEKSKPYLALCTQLLQRTLDSLLKQPLIYGVKFSTNPVFDKQGAVVEFYSTTDHSKPALAAMMFAKSFVMLNQVTYMKHRELQRFALEMIVGVSDDAAAKKMTQLLNNRAHANDILVLLPNAGLKQLSGYMQLDNLKNPTTVYERDCALLVGTNDSMMQRLAEVRNTVLLSANS